MLIDQPNIDLIKRNCDGNSALHYIVRIHACDNESQQKLSRVIEKYAKYSDIDILGKDENTPLHQAVLKKKYIFYYYFIRSWS